MPEHAHAHEAAGHAALANGHVVANGLAVGPNDENCNMQIKETLGNGTAVAVNVAAEHADTALHEAEEAAEKEYKVYPER